MKSKIKACGTRLLLEVQGVRDKIRELEMDNKSLKEEVEYLKRYNKKNSIVIFGVENTTNNLNIK